MKEEEAGGRTKAKTTPKEGEERKEEDRGDVKEGEGKKRGNRGTWTENGQRNSAGDSCRRREKKR